MLTLCDSSRGLDRRGFLTLGTLGLGGLSLPSLLARASGAQLPSHVTGRSVIFLFQQGGPSQLETFDPKPDAPDSTRTVTGVTPTSLPGVFFGDTMSRLAKHADKLTIVRSFATGNSGHNIVPLVCPDTLNANIGTLYSRVVGATRADSGMPTNAVLFPQSVDEKVTKGSARGDISATGPLGQTYAPFIPGGGGQLQANLKLNLPRDRFEDRQNLLSEVGRLQREIEAADKSGVVDSLHQQAVQVLLSGGTASALDLSQEDPRVLQQYDTSKFTAAHGWKKVARGGKGYYNGSAGTIGKLLCLARRLCEAGCGFVTVHADYEGVWDMHADGNNLNVIDGMQAVGRSFDHAVAALIEDIEARGLSDKIMLVCCGEMGRTPRLNTRGGRDHWGKLAPLLLYGGGVKRGQVIGQSTRDGGEPATEAYGVKHLVSTILHTVFDAGQLRLVPSFGHISRLAEHPTIEGAI